VVIVAPSGVLVAAVLLALFLRSPFCVDIVSDVSLFWRAAIRTLVAQISNRRARTGLLKDRLHCASLVAAYAQFHASLELQQFQPVGPPRGSKSARVLCSMSLALHTEAPRQCRTAAFALSSKSPPKPSRLSNARSISNFSRAAAGAGCSSRQPLGKRRSAPCKPQTSKGGSMPSSGRISCTERPEMIAMRVLPCCWMRVNNSRTPAQGLARKRSTRNGASVPS